MHPNRNDTLVTVENVNVAYFIENKRNSKNNILNKGQNE